PSAVSEMALERFGMSQQAGQGKARVERKIAQLERKHRGPVGVAAAVQADEHALLAQGLHEKLQLLKTEQVLGVFGHEAVEARLVEKEDRLEALGLKTPGHGERPREHDAIDLGGDLRVLRGPRAVFEAQHPLARQGAGYLDLGDLFSALLELPEKRLPGARGGRAGLE